VAKVGAGIFAVPAFLTFLNTRIWWGGLQSSTRPGHHQTSARSYLAPHLTSQSSTKTEQQFICHYPVSQ